MRINEQGRLVVNFRTKARFRGLFVESHSGGRIKRAGEFINNNNIHKSHSITNLWALCTTHSLLYHSQYSLPSNLHVIHGDECGSPRPDL